MKMGFRCPECDKDFGINKLKWEQHCEHENGGVVKAFLELVNKTIEYESEDKDGHE